MRLRGPRSRGPALGLALLVVVLIAIAALYILYFAPR